jgi:hypothetical protein
MAENFATLDYRTQEEVITVIKHLTSVLSTAGMQVIDLLSPSHLLAQLHDTRPLHNAPHQPPPPDFPTYPADQEISNAPSLSAPPEMPHIDVAVMRSSITIGIVMLLKAHLKSLYGLSEEWVCCNRGPSILLIFLSPHSGNVLNLCSARRALSVTNLLSDVTNFRLRGPVSLMLLLPSPRSTT